MSTRTWPYEPGRPDCIIRCEVAYGDLVGAALYHSDDTMRQVAAATLAEHRVAVAVMVELKAILDRTTFAI